MSRGAKRRSLDEEEDEEGNRNGARQGDSSQSQSQSQTQSPEAKRQKRSDRSETVRPDESDDGASSAAEEDELEDEDGAAAEGSRYLEEAEAVVQHEMGVIEKIVLKNFMCHDHLSVTFGPQLNFVIGHNGSGKSAVLTGMVIALGGKASATMRATALRSFVKEGRSEATVEVHIKNAGIDAYEPEKYQGKIIVERTIRSDGGTSWKIRNREGRIVSTRREELDAICDHAAIQVDNPLNVLTQDAARQFLSTANPEELYDFFMRGTQLSQLEMEYDGIQRNTDIIKRAVKQKQASLGDLRDKAKELEQRQQLLRRAEEELKEIEVIRAKYVWAQVKVKETYLETEVARAERHTVHLEKYQHELRDAEAEIRRVEDRISQGEQEVRDMTAMGEPVLASYKEVMKSLQDIGDSIKILRNDSQKINEQYRRAKQQSDDIEKRIQEAERDAAGGGRNRRLNLNKQREQLSVEIKKIEGGQREYEERLDELREEIESERAREEEARLEMERLRPSVAASEMLIRNLRSTKTNHLSAYSNNMPKLVDLVNRETRWRGPVVGPIGAKIKLKDARWDKVLESVIGNTLNAFCVTNHQDRTLLLDLKRRAGCEEIPILTGSDELFDFTSGEPDGSILTILRVLDIPDEFVKRQLINSLSIERSALVERRQDGDALLRERPRNVKLAFSLDHYRLQYSEAGGSTQTLTHYRGPPRLSSDVEALLGETIERHKEEERKLSAVVQARSQIARHLSHLQEETHRFQGLVSGAQRDARRKHAERERIEEQLGEDQPTNITALYEARNEVEEEASKLQSNFRELQAQMEQEKDSKEPFERRKKELSTLIDARREDHEAKKEGLVADAVNRVTAHQHKIRLEKKASEIEKKIKDAQDKVKIATRDLQASTEQAQRCYDYVEVDETVEVYEKLMKQVEARIRQAERQGGQDLAAMRREFEQVSSAYTRASDDIEKLHEACRRFRTFMKLRVEKWHAFRSGIALRTKNLFSYFLSTRGFDGRLIFDHDDRRLALQVITDSSIASKTQGSKEAKALSGGEKSYSTICLLLALWEAIGCPIRCLDEFDVFMDAVNRRMSMKMIMDVAKRMSHRQYILITPQNIQNITLGPNVRIHRLNDPVRNQSTL